LVLTPFPVYDRTEERLSRDEVERIGL